MYLCLNHIHGRAVHRGLRNLKNSRSEDCTEFGIEGFYRIAVNEATTWTILI